MWDTTKVGNGSHGIDSSMCKLIYSMMMGYLNLCWNSFITNLSRERNILNAISITVPTQHFLLQVNSPRRGRGKEDGRMAPLRELPLTDQRPLALWTDSCNGTLWRSQNGALILTSVELRGDQNHPMRRRMNQWQESEKSALALVHHQNSEVKGEVRMQIERKRSAVVSLLSALLEWTFLIISIEGSAFAHASWVCLWCCLQTDPSGCSKKLRCL